MSDLKFMFGASEPEGIDLVQRPGELEEYKSFTLSQIRNHHTEMRKGIRDVTLLGFGVDHGLNAHSGNGPHWRSTPVAILRLDYLKNGPLAYARLEDEQATELLAQLAEAVAIRVRTIGMK